MDEIRRLLDAGARVDGTPWYPRWDPSWQPWMPPPLAIAAAAGHVDAVRALVDAGADLAKADDFGRIALEYAAAYGQEEVVRALVDAGADVTTENQLQLSVIEETARKWSMARFALDERSDRRGVGSHGHFSHEKDLNVRVEESDWPRFLARLELTARALLEVGAKDRKGRALCDFARHGNDSMVRALLSSNAYTVMSVQEALGSAAQFGHETVVHTLLDARYVDDGDGDLRRKLYASALYSAAACGQVPIMRIFLDSGVLDAKSIGAAVIGAVRYKQIRALRVLLDAGADVNVPDEYGPYTPLMEAISQDHELMARELIQAGADVNVVFPNSFDNNRLWVSEKMRKFGGQTLLMRALVGENESIARALIQAGADVNARGEGIQDTALMLAVRKNDESTIRMLIEAGADVEARRNRQGKPKKLITCEYWEREKWPAENRWCTKLTPSDAKEYGCETALTIAALDGCETAVRLLLEAGASVEADYSYDDPPYDSEDETPLDECGLEFTPLMVAARQGHESIVRALLDVGASVDEDMEFTAPLIAAAYEGHEYVVRLLVERGASLEIEHPRNCRTALMYASMQGHMSIVLALIEAGANVDHISWHGETALSLTRSEAVERALRMERERRERIPEDPYVELARKKARVDHLSRAMSILDEHSHALPEGAYVEICSALQGACAES